MTTANSADIVVSVENASSDGAPPTNLTVSPGNSSAVQNSFAITIFLSAFLLFSVQLLLGKLILPVFGGAPSVWTACMMFFQTVLLVGYALAHILASRVRTQGQTLFVFVLLGSSLGLMVAVTRFWSTPITPGYSWLSTWGTSPSLTIVLFLLAAIGLPFLILSTTGPLLQSWFSKVHPGISPYRLYALSNAGSLLGLLSYPFLIEPTLRLRAQAWFWCAGYGAYVVCYGLCARKSRGILVKEPQNPAPPHTAEVVRGSRMGLWIVLSFCASTLFLATTNFICQEVAVIPFLWVLPLSVYLLSLILAFEGSHWYRRSFFHAAFAAASGWVIIVTLPTGPHSIYPQIAGCLTLLFVCCMVCHGEAARLRPAASHLTKFYLCISSGGALGGIFVSLVAPHAFPGYWEYPLSVIACGGLLLGLAEKDSDSWLHTGKRWVAAGLLSGVVLLAAEISRMWANVAWLRGNGPRYAALAIALTVILHVKRGRKNLLPRNVALVRVSSAIMFLTLIAGLLLPLKTFLADQLAVSRNFYGVLSVVDIQPENYLMLQHGKTIHGFQFKRPDLARFPTGYYGQHSGVNILLRTWKRNPRNPLRVGLVGMGAGTLAALGKPGDTYRFYEINPDIPKFSMGEKPYFTFVRDSAANVEVVMGDGRISLEREAKSGEKQNFDVLVADAFSSDAIPLHLLTREAFALYLQHLRDDDSVIAVHVTNHWVDLGPVMAGIAKEFHLESVRIHPTWMSGFSSNTDWILLSKTRTELSDPELKEASVLFPGKAQPILWTDDFSNLLHVLR